MITSTEGGGDYGETGKNATMLRQFPVKVHISGPSLVHNGRELVQDLAVKAKNATPFA